MSTNFQSRDGVDRLTIKTSSSPDGGRSSSIPRNISSPSHLNKQNNNHPQEGRKSSSSSNSGNAVNYRTTHTAAAYKYANKRQHASSLSLPQSQQSPATRTTRSASSPYAYRTATEVSTTIVPVDSPPLVSKVTSRKGTTVPVQSRPDSQTSSKENLIVQVQSRPHSQASKRNFSVPVHSRPGSTSSRKNTAAVSMIQSRPHTTSSSVSSRRSTASISTRQQSRPHTTSSSVSSRSMTQRRYGISSDQHSTSFDKIGHSVPHGAVRSYPSNMHYRSFSEGVEDQYSKEKSKEWNKRAIFEKRNRNYGAHVYGSSREQQQHKEDIRRGLLTQMEEKKSRHKRPQGMDPMLQRAIAKEQQEMARERQAATARRSRLNEFAEYNKRLIEEKKQRAIQQRLAEQQQDRTYWTVTPINWSHTLT